MFRNIEKKDLSFDKETTDPDMLWKRNPVRNKVGRINSFGRYEPGWDLAPEMSRADGTKKASRFGLVCYIVLGCSAQLVLLSSVPVSNCSCN